MLRPSIITRFAPSPTGYLHLGHAYSALFAYEMAQSQGGRFLLRLEDIDQTRCRNEYIEAAIDDLTWLGLKWDGPVRQQSQHFSEYRAVLDRLREMGLLYPCFCTRKEIVEEIARAEAAPHLSSIEQDRLGPNGVGPNGVGPDGVGPDGPLYPGTCHAMGEKERLDRQASGAAFAWRLDMTKACAMAGDGLKWHDAARGWQEARPEMFGDVVLARKDVPVSYHLAVTHDDALQEVTMVTRGEDLFHATHIHRLIQALMDWPTPNYAHHRLLTNEAGQRLAKRDGARSLQSLRADGMNAETLRQKIRNGSGYWPI